MSAQPETSELRSPTTGEPIEVVARRNMLGVLLIIVADVAGTIVLCMSYLYLHYLNTNKSWLPEGKESLWNTTGMNITWPGTVTPAAQWPFWAICAGILVMTLVFWQGIRSLKRGSSATMVSASLVVTIGLLALTVAEYVKLSGYPFKPTDGGYASALTVIGISNFLHLLLSAFLAAAIWNRTRVGRISPQNPFQASLVGAWLVWMTISSVVLAALTFFLISPSADPTLFGTFGS